MIDAFLFLSLSPLSYSVHRQKSHVRTTPSPQLDRWGKTLNKYWHTSPLSRARPYTLLSLESASENPVVADLRRANKKGRE